MLSDEDYAALLRKMAGPGLSDGEFDAALDAAGARGDAAACVRLFVLAGADAQAAASLRLVPEADLPALVDALAAWRNYDPAWHVLFAIAEDPRHVPLVERAVAGWDAAARLLPRAWLAKIREGEFAEGHRLVREVVLAGPDEAALLTRASACRSFGGLRGLGLRSPGAALAPALLGPGLPNLARLVLESLTLDDASTRALTTTDRFPSVESLEVSGRAEPAHAAELLVGSSFPRLRRLKLSTQAITRDRRAFREAVLDAPMPLDALAAALRGRSSGRAPYTLTLAGLGVDAAGIRAFAAEPLCASLRGVEFTFAHLDSDDLAALARVPAAWERFAVHPGGSGPEGARALLDARWLGGLRHLDLSNHAIGDDMGAALVERLSGGPLESLALRHCGLGERTAGAFARAALPGLRHLDLSYNPLSDDDAARTVAGSDGLEHVDLLGTGASVATARALSRPALRAGLRRANLGDKVGDEAAAILAAGRFYRLERLQMRGVSDAALAEFSTFAAFVTNRTFA